MARIRGNKYISVLERKIFDNVSRVLDPNVKLGTKLYELTEALSSEIEGEPISESFPKSVHDQEDHGSIPGVPSIDGLLDETAHDALDHTGITGCGGEGAETFTQEVHDLEDHSTLPGIPSITGLLDETAHDALDHAGLTGIPSVTGLLDETAHDALDHTGLTGCGGLDETAHDLLDHTGLTGIPAAEAFTKDVHDLEDHGSLPGIPSVTGLLDETAHDALDHAGLTGIPSVTGLLDETAHDALDHTGLTGIPSVTGLLDETSHDALDHTGLTGIPAEETFTEGAHALVDHSSQLGVPSTAGLLDETAHDALDHAGLTGIPSVTGLLDETAHDLLDHTGLTGVGGTSNFKDSFVTEAELPSTGPTDLTGVSSRALTTGSSTSGATNTSLTNERAVRLIAPDPVNTLVVTGRIDGDTGQTPNWQIWDNLGAMGVPGTKLYNSNGPNLVSTGWQTTTYTFEFDPPLPAGTYWLALAPTSGEAFMLNLDGSAVGEAYVARNAGNWSQWGIQEGQTLSYMASSLLDIDYEDGEIAFTQDTNKLHRYVSATDTWVELNPDETFKSTAHALVDHEGLTGIPSVAGLLDETAHDDLDHTGLTGIILEIAETHEDLPTDGFYWAQGYGTADGSKECNTSYDFADDFIGKGEHNYLFKLKHENITNNTCTVEIHADNAGVPAAAVLHTLSHVINSPAAEIETEFDFGVLNLTDAATYWITISYNAVSGTLLASSTGTSKEKFGEGSWEDHSGALAFVLIISTTIENSKVYLCQEENVIYGVDDTNTKVKKLTIPVIEIPKDTMYMLDSQDLSAYLPADNSSGDMVALIPMSDENFFFGIYANPIYIYMWRSNWAVPGWQLINPVLPTQGTEISYTNYSAPKGTMWLKEAEDGTFSLMYQGASGQGTIGGVSDADVEGASGYNVWYESLVNLQAYAPDYGYGAVHFVWEEKCLYYYDDDTDPENPVWVKLAPLQAANQAASTATTIEGLVTDFNALLTKLKNAGMMAADV